MVKNLKSMKALLRHIQNEKSKFELNFTLEKLQQCVFLRAKLDNRRIINQQGLFLLVGMGASRIEPACISKYYIKVGKNPIQYIIPSEQKEGILHELNAVGINQSIIYPELENVAKHLKVTFNDPPEKITPEATTKLRIARRRLKYHDLRRIILHTCRTLHKREKAPGAI
ncbi:hypothetical protein AGMMS49944_31250 [Spirochaetia bacterium]|nr:hypothetical protein AGMMS49944_31250 [Spirochaetia bacterium]